MNNIFIKILILILILVFITAFSSSYSSLNIDNLAYVLAIGIDSSNDNKLEVSFQFSQPSSPSESGSNKKSKPIINTVTASSISNAINLINGYLGKQINMSHCKVIIFSEEFASKGISDEIYTLINDPQVRPTANIIISKSPAKYYIEQTQPQLENLISRYYETFTRSSQYTGYMPHATLADFYNSLVSKTSEPYTILGGINSDDSNNTENINSQKDYNVKSNNSSVSGKNGSENIGIAVFKHDKLIGELNALESISLLTIKNRVNQFMISVPNYQDNSQYLDIYLTPSTQTKVKINTKTPSPFIEINCNFSGRIYSMSENSKYLSNENLTAISDYCNSYIKNMISDLLYKTSKEFESDILDLGRFSLKNFVTIKDFNDYDWKNNYKNSFFKVNVDTSIKSSMLITES